MSDEIERIVTRVLYRYARGVDRRDYEAIAACYWPDAVDEHGSFTGDAPAYVDWLREMLPHVTVSTHQFTNVLVEVIDESTAECEAYCLNVNVFRRDGASTEAHMTSGLRYLDRFERRGDEWRIAHRRCLTDWTRTDTVSATAR